MAAPLTDATNLATDLAGAEQQFARLFAKVTRRLEAGGEVDLQSVLSEYPEHAERLQELLPTLQAIAGWACAGDDNADSNSFAGQEREISGRTLGDFKIIRVLGRGGMGVVYEAEQLSLGRRVALKVLPFAALLDEKRIKRFQNEARAAAMLDHPHIVPIISVGEDRSVYYYAMTLIRGQSLAEVIADLRDAASPAVEQPSTAAFMKNLSAVDAAAANAESCASSSPDKVLQRPAKETRKFDQAAISTQPVQRTAPAFYRTVAGLGIQAAAALQHAHEQSVLHRDIKPANLLIDHQGKLWITDFGLARLEVDAGMTMTGDLLGTLRYMSPESIAGGANKVLVDQRSDVYALGVTLYELLALRPPFDSSDRQKLIQQITQQEPPPLDKIDRSIPADLQTIVLKALEKNPATRYQTAKSLADDLQRYLDDKPIEARRPTLVARTRKWSHRNRVVLATTIAATLLAWALASVWIWREREKATASAELANKNLDRAISTIEQLLSRVEDEPLLKREELQPLRDVFLHDAVRFNEDLIEDSRDNLEARLAVGKAYDRIGRIQNLQNNLQESVAAFKMACKMFEELLADSWPTDPGYREQLARTQCNFANALVFGGNNAEAFEEGLRLFQESLRHYQAIVERTKDPHDRLAAIGESIFCLGGMGMAYSNLNRFDKIENSCRQAIRLSEEVSSESLEAHPDARVQRAYRRHLAFVNCFLAYRLARTGQLGEALILYRKAIELGERNLEQWPNDAGVRARLAQDKYTFGHQLSIVGRDEDAADVVRSAVEDTNYLTEHFPDVPVYRALRADAQLQLGCLISETGGESEQAEQLIREAAATREALIRDFPSGESRYSGLVSNYAELGDHHRRSKDETSARAAYQKAIDFGCDQDYPMVQIAVATAHTRIAQSWHDAHQYEPALSSYGMAAEVFERVLPETDGGHLSHHKTIIEFSACMKNLGMLHHELGNLHDSEQCFRKAISLLETAYVIAREKDELSTHFDKNHDQFLTDLAWSHQELAGFLNELDRRAEAEVSYHNAIEAHQRRHEYLLRIKSHNYKDLSGAQFLLGKMLYREKHLAAEAAFRDSLENISKAAELDPDDSYFRDGKGITAIFLAHTIPQAGGSDEEALQLAHDAVRTLQTVSQDFPEETNKRYQLSQAYQVLADLLAGNKAVAAQEACLERIDILQQLCKDQPNKESYQDSLGGAIEQLARFRLLHGDMEGAQELLQQRLDLCRAENDVNQAKCLVDLARELSDRGEIDEQVNAALAQLRLVSDDEIEDEDVVTKWELQYRLEGEADNAEHTFEQLLAAWRQELRKNPDSGDTMVKISRIQSQTPFTSLADYEEALRCIERVHELSPGIDWFDRRALDHEAVAHHAWALYRTGRLEEAEQRFEQVERQDHPYVALGLAMTKAQLGKLDEGRPYYELGVERFERYYLWDRQQYAVLQEAAALYDDEARLGQLAAERWVAK